MALNIAAGGSKNQTPTVAVRVTPVGESPSQKALHQTAKTGEMTPDSVASFSLAPGRYRVDIDPNSLDADTMLTGTPSQEASVNPDTPEVTRFVVNQRPYHPFHLARHGGPKRRTPPSAPRSRATRRRLSILVPDEVRDQPDDAFDADAVYTRSIDDLRIPASPLQCERHADFYEENRVRPGKIS